MANFWFAKKANFFSSCKAQRKTFSQRTAATTSHRTKANEQLQFSSAKTYCKLAVQHSFFEQYRSCVCTTVTLSHRFKAFTPAFCRQNRFRHEPPESFTKSFPTELWIVPGVQRFANLWCTFGSFRTREKNKPVPFLGSSEVSQTSNQHTAMAASHRNN